MAAQAPEPSSPEAIREYHAHIYYDGATRLMLNRRGLTVLVHPDTGHPVPDHADFPLWLGKKLSLDIDKLSQ